MTVTAAQVALSVTANDLPTPEWHESVMVTRFEAKTLRPIYIREWLDHLKISQARLADLMGTSEGNVSRWIGEPHRITLDIISAIADALTPFAPELRDAGNLFRLPSAVQIVEQAKHAAQRLIEVLPDAAPAAAKPVSSHPSRKRSLIRRSA